MSAPAAHGRALAAAARRPARPPRGGVDPVFAQIWQHAERLGLNQSQLAARAGVPHSLVSDLVAGRRGTTTFTALLLAGAVGCRIDVVPDGGAG